MYVRMCTNYFIEPFLTIYFLTYGRDPGNGHNLLKLRYTNKSGFISTCCMMFMIEQNQKFTLNLLFRAIIIFYSKIFLFPNLNNDE